METTCRFCKSENIKYSKQIHIGPITGNTYHVRISCLNCRKSWNTPKTKDLMEKIRFQSWELGRKAQKRLDREKNKLTQPTLF